METDSSSSYDRSDGDELSDGSDEEYPTENIVGEILTSSPTIEPSDITSTCPPISESLDAEPEGCIKKSAPGLGDMRDLLRVLPTDGQPGLKKVSVSKPRQRSIPHNKRNASYNPTRLTAKGALSTMRNAMFEQRELWRVKEPTLLHTMRGLYDEYKLGTCGFMLTSHQEPLRTLKGNYGVYRVGRGWILKPIFTSSSRTFFRNESEVHYTKGVFLYKKGKFPYQTADFPYDAAYDGVKFVRPRFGGFTKTYYFGPTTNDTLLVCDDTLLLNESRLYSSVANVNVMKVFLPRFSLIQGVPGCGKTTYILENVQPSDIVLFATREGAQEFRHRYVKRKVKKMSDETDESGVSTPVNPDRLLKSLLSSGALQEHFRTVDSYLITQSLFTPHASRIIVDEALLVHLGSLLFAAVKAGAKEVQLVGDARQIPYINRQHDCESRFFSPVAVAAVSEELTITFRCTNTTAAILSQYYRKGMRAVSMVRDEMTVKAFTAVDKLPVDGNVKVLVFKQREKKELKRRGHDVSTIHEYQGNQAEHIVVVRTSKRKERIYNSLPHCIVAISRHTEKFTYYTPVKTDQLAKWVLKSKKLTENQYIRSLQIAPVFMGETEPST